MKQKPVLIISSKLDLHARAVAWSLQKHGFGVSYFDTSKVGEPQDWWSFDTDSAVRPSKGEAAYQAAWDRRRFPKCDDPRVHIADREFVKNESAYFDRAVLKTLLIRQPSLRWIDHPHKVDHAENKLEQILAAHESGLNVPRTLISRNYQQVRKFAHSQGSVVVKPFRGHLWFQDDAPRHEAIANRVDDINLLSEASISACPAIYQEVVNKIADIRVVCIGPCFYAVRYKIKPGFEANFDCRVNLRYEHMTIADAIELDEKTKSGLHILMQHFGISYASVDFAESTDGKLHFLDLNPQGQFLFNEHFAPSHHLIDAMARHIVGPNVIKDDATIVTIEEYAASEDHAEFQSQYDLIRGGFNLPNGTFSCETTKLDNSRDNRN
jgi:glutathione synthase/RimK-type ligase-like ATP-grasp enzyme